MRVELARSHVFDHTLTQRTDWRSRPVTALPAAQVCNPFPPTFDVHGRDDLECPSRPRSANGGRSQAERPRINLLRVRGNRQPSTCPSLILCGEQALSRIAAHSAHRLDELTAAELSASGSGHFGSDGLSMHVNKVSHVRTIDRVAKELGEDVDWLYHVALEMEPEDGAIGVRGLGDDSVMTFTDFGVDNLVELIKIPRERTPRERALKLATISHPS